MIYVDRAREPAPAVLVDPQKAGPQEITRAIDFYKKPENEGKAFLFKAYKHDDVKDALERLFNMKCAYCESEYGNVMPVEIEHWRPKGEVEDDEGKKIKPGYYWLAADWDNLLPSCIDCNRRRYQKVGLGDGEAELLGKQNSFPLSAGSSRAKKPPEEAQEIPLLLHPCKDRPEQFLSFAEEKKSRGIVRAKADGQNQPLAKAEASLTVYALNRNRLVLARKKMFKQIEAQIGRVKEAAERVENAPNAVTKQRESAVYDREMNVLLAFAEPTEAYSLMARQLVTQFLGNPPQ